MTHRLLFLILLVAAMLASGCSAKPRLDPKGVDHVQFISLERSQTRVATPQEEHEFFQAYESARPLRGDFGTTPPARVEVVFVSGESLVVTGGGETYSTVESLEPPLNLRGDELHALMEQIAAGDVHF